MGRYYEGDIEGKFWFAVQSSNAADRFGSEGYEPSYLNYYFEKEEHLQTVQEELKKIEDTIGESNMKKLDDFFKSVNGYNDDIMKKAEVDEIWSKHNEDYADYVLGKKIEKCLIDKGSCEFTAEL